LRTVLAENGPLPGGMNQPKYPRKDIPIGLWGLVKGEKTIRIMIAGRTIDEWIDFEKMGRSDGWEE
jgi:hypothetical protein